MNYHIFFNSNINMVFKSFGKNAYRIFLLAYRLFCAREKKFQLLVSEKDNMNILVNMEK